jgi:preprotein translocase subunit YajC
MFATKEVDAMRSRRKIAMTAVLAAALLMVAGVSLAVAKQSSDAGQTAAPAAFGPGGEGFGAGPGGPGGPGRRGGLLGEVTKVENNTVTVKLLSGDEKSFQVDDKTRYRKKDGDGSLADVVAGEKIAARLARPADDSSDPIALMVIVGIPEPNKPVVGEITAINGDTVTVKTADGDKEVKIPALTNGMRIGVIAGDDGTVRGLMYDPPERPQGAPDEAPAPDAGDSQA